MKEHHRGSILKKRVTTATRNKTVDERGEEYEQGQEELKRAVSREIWGK